MSENTVRFRLAAYTDPAGKWNETAPKKGNEDDLFVDADLSNEIRGQFLADEVIELSEAGCLMAVADGMGGMNAGEVASAIAIETLKSAFSKDRLTDEILSSAHSRTKYLEKVVVEADAAIKRKAREDNECEGMGSTIILAWLYADELAVTWCGDSRAYLFRDSDGIRQISKDHSYVQGLVDAGSITEVEAFDHPYGNIITRSLGDPEKKAQPDSVRVHVCKGDIIMLCSDGLSGVLRDRKSCDRDGNVIHGDNLEDIIRANRASMTECREALWKAAEKADWYDNVTAVLCEIVDGDENGLVRIEEGSASKDKVNKSFINIRIHKKGVRIAGLVLAAVLFCVAVGLAGVKYIQWSQQKGIFVQMDSLQKVSDSLGISFISKQLAGLERDKIDSCIFENLKKEFEARSLILAGLDSLSKKADSLGLSGSVAVISGLKDSVRISANPECNLQKLRTNIELAVLLQNQIKIFLEQNQSKLSAKQKHQIENFKTAIAEKEYVGHDDKEKWDRFSKQLFGQDIQKDVKSSLKPKDATPETTPSLTPVTE